jgi:hypothetical protein
MRYELRGIEGKKDLTGAEILTTVEELTVVEGRGRHNPLHNATTFYLTTQPSMC